MTDKLSLSSSKGPSSPSLESFGNNPSFQGLRAASAPSNTTGIATTRTPSSTVTSCDESHTSPHVSAQSDATTLSSTASSPATTLTITSCSSSSLATTAATTPVSSARQSFSHPPPEDVIKLLLSTTTYIYDNLTKLIGTNNTLRRLNPRIPGDQPICQADVRRRTIYSRTATAVKGSSSISCPNGMTHDAFHIVDSHRAFARAIEAEIAKLNSALAYFSPPNATSRLRSLVSLPTSTWGGRLRTKLGGKHRYAGGCEEVTIWSDIKEIICMYDWLWTYSYSGSVETWQEITWACAVVTGVYGAGGLEGANARMRDYGIAHAGVVDRFYAASRAAEREAEERRAWVRILSSQGSTTMQDETNRVAMVERKKMVKGDGGWVPVDPGVFPQEGGEALDGLQGEVGCVARSWKVQLQVPGGVVAVGVKFKRY